MKQLNHSVDFCVIGGGMAGICAALAAARRGLKTILMHDRPVLGGNASSEIRMWICGAHGPNNRETGILEEIQLDNLYYNPDRTYAGWDAVLYGKLISEPNFTLLLNCSCNEAVMEGSRIRSVTGRQLTTETSHRIEARTFADCSGDGILAPLIGADFRIGREARSEFDEDIAPESADKKTMGLSCLLQARETDSPKPFRPMPWAHTFADDTAFPNRPHTLEGMQNFWWIETGGEADSIHDAEEARNELLKIVYGVWDHIKNRGDHGADNWVLDWVGFLPGKRESRRFIGDHTLTQNDVRAGGPFSDIVAYGGWSMDDHHPAGFRHPGKPTIFHPAPSPFGIPYRSLYSRNIVNLFFAGRNISATHAAMSSSRVMATCALLGQAVGTAAALAARTQSLPGDLFPNRIAELQDLLMEDDAWLPGRLRKVAELSRLAKLTASDGDPASLLNGMDRPTQEALNGWEGDPGSWIEYRFQEIRHLQEARLVFDSDLNRPEKNMPALRRINDKDHEIPRTLIQDFRLEIEKPGGVWMTVARTTDNFQRLVRVPLNADTRAIRFIPEATRGLEKARLFAFDLK